MTGRKNSAQQIPPVAPYKTSGNFPKGLVWANGRYLQYTIFLSCPQAAQALVVSSYYIYIYFLIFMRTFSSWNELSWHCYRRHLLLHNERPYAKRDSGLSACGGVMLQRFEFKKVCMGENVKRHFSRNFDICSIKMTYLNALLSFLLSCHFSVRSEAY